MEWFHPDVHAPAAARSLVCGQHGKAHLPPATDVRFPAPLVWFLTVLSYCFVLLRRLTVLSRESSSRGSIGVVVGFRAGGGQPCGRAVDPGPSFGACPQPLATRSDPRRPAVPAGSKLGLRFLPERAVSWFQRTSHEQPATRSCACRQLDSERRTRCSLITPL